MSGASPPTASISVQTLRTLGSEAAQFLHRLLIQSIDEDGRKKSRDFKTLWRRCMSVALQRCNASVISRKLARLGHSKIFTVDSSFAVVILWRRLFGAD